MAQDKIADKWTFHFQSTVIEQRHSAFRSPYSGLNSLADTVEPAATSITMTLFAGRTLWKGAAFYFNPEMSGGHGLSSATGVAGALNGETYRIGDPSPGVYLARAYIMQSIPLGFDYEKIDDDQNSIAREIPSRRLEIIAGKFSMTDFFDDNAYSKDPRSQFLNWSLWANGAWDYPADVKGYTYGLVVQVINPRTELRFSSVSVPAIANSSVLEYRLNGAHSETVELGRHFSFNEREGIIRLFLYRNSNRAPSYKAGLLAIENGNNSELATFRGLSEPAPEKGHKNGIGLNLDQEIATGVGFFSRAGINDGRYASWAFTEIDRTFTAGLYFSGRKWGREGDAAGVAAAINGISKQHRRFLERGGYGFIIGDGKLNYANEIIMELFYNMCINRFFKLSGDYQMVANPAYNRDRGPVSVFALRGHAEF